MAERRETEGLDNTRLGTVGKREDGKRFVRFERLLKYPIDVVWSALTDPVHLARWFPGLTMDAKEGGAFQIWFSEDCTGPAHIQGNITIFDAPNVLEMGTMRWELSRNGSGCRLVFTDILAFEDSRSEDEFTNSVLGGWHKYLDMLEYALNGGNGDPRLVPDYDYSKINSLVSDTRRLTPN